MDDLLFYASLNILECIQKGDYNELKKLHCLERISEEDIIKVLEEYGGTLEPVKEEKYRKTFQWLQMQNKYLTYLDLIIDGERSDLTLICEIELENEKVVKAIVDDLHVL